MDFLRNFDWIELLFIFILGMLLFGPERLPAIGAKLGSYVRTLQGMSAQFISQWWEEAGGTDVTREGTQVVSTVREVVAEVRSAIRPIEDAAAAVVPEAQQALAPGVGDTGYEPLSRVWEETETDLQMQALVGRVAELEEQVRGLQEALACLEMERSAALSG